ncbi:type I secretion protein [Aminobacter sp. AP02]|uniref:type I secretion protein n=1 Tax=Aminobacter sp. AP02 TaxID=2135737 RepID=UPI000D6AC3E2|nr:type I secretion protein [Aminobacter sp. AP02]PWK71587.1 hypothetical protein C8K44_10699 [Aminobacter sp. AP02]
MYSAYFGKVTEAIVHFAGLFATADEEARLKQAYDEFRATHKADDKQPEHSTYTIKIDASHQFEDFDPYVPYKPLKPGIEMATVLPYVHLAPQDIPIPDGPLLSPPDHNFPHAFIPGWSISHEVDVHLPELDPPGSVAIFINQEIRLSDNDYVSVGGSGLKFTPPPVDDSQMEALHQAAANINPIDDLTLPGTPQEMAQFVTTAVARLESFSADGHGDADIFTTKGTTIEGTYLNGKLIDEADTPKMEDYVDYLKDKDTTVEGPNGPLNMSVAPDSSDFMHGWGVGTTSPSVNISTGDNTVINSAVVVNDWASASVMAVIGDHISVNAIVQINATSDIDSIGAAISGWPFDPGQTADQSFNIAMFKHIDPTADQAPAEAAPDFPSYYVVTQITGDLIMMNWINQFSFVTDNDVVLAASSGVQTYVSTGDNTGFNAVDLTELGHNYDLIIIGGNVYDASIIQQFNLLIDNDTIGAVSGFETTGQGSVSTAGNLTWNQASIITVGTGQYQALPDAYKQANDDLSAGKKDLPDSILQDPAFAGSGLLRVLYISGDIYNLQYLNQATIMGDSDQIALAMNKIAPDPNADWTIATGGNQLVNHATIVDVDGANKIYVGGDHYSDEILIQANLVSSAPDMGAQNPDILVNEAVAFLTDSTGDTGSAPHVNDHITPQPADSASADVMQHMLG